jgi:hypothetical protein
MKNLLSIAVLLLPTMAVLGQDQRSPIKVPQVLNRGLGTPITPYTDRPPDFTLVPHGADARHGHIWVQNVGNGLLIAGEVDGDPPVFPRNKNLILERDHVEIWLADAKDPELPPVGWNEFQEKLTLPNGADSCAEWVKKSIAENKLALEEKCRRWVDLQSHYRPYFKRLFLRQYLVTPDYAVESFAARAYDEIITHFASDQPGNEEIPALLKPHSHLQMWPGPGKDGVGYTFEIMIPFVDFPPLSATELSDLRLLVDVFNAPEPGKKVGAYSTSSPSRVYGRSGTFNLLHFDPPHHFHLTPCDLPVSGPDEYGKGHAAWFVPKTDQEFEFESDAFVVANDGAGYPDGPKTLSPIAHPARYFWHGIAENEWVCGPHLSYRKGDRTHYFNAHVDESGFDAHRLPDGDLLIKVGPRAYGVNSSGQCGACPRTELRILRLSADMKIHEVLQLGGVIDTGTGVSQDFTVSPDWLQVAQYDQRGLTELGQPEAWSSITWCLGESGYEECGHKDSVEPPDPPVLKELRKAN